MEKGSEKNEERMKTMKIRKKMMETERAKSKMSSRD